MSGFGGRPIGIVNYGVGNLRSLQGSLQRLGAGTRLLHDQEDAREVAGIILPGVGAFGSAIDSLKQSGLDRVVRNAPQRGVPVLGVCLGMQLLFDSSDETPDCRGLALLPGHVTRLTGLGQQFLPIPHVGYNSIIPAHHPGELLAGMEAGADFYFAHSFAIPTDKCSADLVAARTRYTCDFVSVVDDGRFIVGTQFHPELSSRNGTTVLRRFLQRCEC